jgi:hypothetical protein
MMKDHRQEILFVRDCFKYPEFITCILLYPTIQSASFHNQLQHPKKSPQQAMLLHAGFPVLERDTTIEVKR